MALVLNGDGNITGLSAGGLPDGSVTADDIASLPAGSVLQVQSDSVQGDLTTSSTSYIATGLSIDFTPKSNNSTIYVQILGGRVYAQSTEQVDVALGTDGTVSSNRTISTFITGGDMHVSNCGLEIINNTSTTQRTYAWYYKASGTVSLNQGADYSIHMVITEVAG